MLKMPIRPVASEELNAMAQRQQQQIESQHQLLLAKEQRLRFLKAQESRGSAVSLDNEKLRRLKERVEAQESKLRRLRALKGQIDVQKTYNVALSKYKFHIQSKKKEKNVCAFVDVSRVARKSIEMPKKITLFMTHISCSPSTIVLFSLSRSFFSAARHRPGHHSSMLQREGEGAEHRCGQSGGPHQAARGAETRSSWLWTRRAARCKQSAAASAHHGYQRIGKTSTRAYGECGTERNEEKKKM